jgi:asparagine synthase (glutamine-hydrolysing)
MCGFLGHITFDNKLIDKSRLINSVNIIENRGPDNLGVVIESDFGLAFRRLSIIDLSENANQPFLSHDKNYVCVFNGQIYNYLEIYQEIKNDFIWKSKSDTELLLNSWIKWGHNCLNKLDGMFSFAIWDKSTKILYAARDRIGEKPFYYYLDDKNFYFASRPKVIINLLPEISKDYDIQSIRSYLDSGYIPGSRSIYKNIKKLKAGYYLKFSKEDFYTRPYWEIKNFSTDFSLFQNKKENDVIDELEDILVRNLKKRFISDVPLGIFLSSGIDSSLITAIAKKKIKLDSNLKTFSIGFDNRIFDESPNSRKISRFLETDHYERNIDANDLIKLIPNFFKNFDEPFFDSSAFPLMAASQLASEHVKVVLTGDGGDELFGGYNYYLIINLLEKIKYIPDSVKKILAYLLNLIPNYKINLIAETLLKKNLIESFSFVRSIIKKNHNVLSNDVVDNTINMSEIFDKTYSTFNNQAISTAEACMKLDIIYTLNDDYLQKSDLASMSCSLESRSPFLSKEIVEWSAKLPINYKINFFKKKYILKKLLRRYLPDHLINKKKIGFEAPIKHWMNNELHNWTKERVFNKDYYKNLPVDQNSVEKLFISFSRNNPGTHTYLWAILMLLEFNKRQLSS